MIRFVFRLAATIALAIAVIMAVVDATRSVAVSAAVLTPLGESWQAAAPETYAAARNAVAEHAWPVLWDPVIVTVLALPGFAVFALLALGLFAIGHRPSRRRGARAAGM